MKAGDWVIWKDAPGEVVTVYNDGLNLVLRVPNYTVDMITNRRSHMFKHEVITVETSDCTPIAKEVADIMMSDT